jgi:putative membrane protein
MTRASTATLPFLRNPFQQALLAVYTAVWIWAAISPHDRADWLLENLLVFVAVGFTVWLYRTEPLSNISVLFITIFMIFHTIGSHYTYSLVPMGDWLKDAAGLERNHYDRVIHFSFGLLISYPVLELLLCKGLARGVWGAFVVFAIISAASGIYELIEWGAAVVVDPEAGLAFLGTQGDPFDSQKDHALALAGSIIALVGAGLQKRFVPRRG